MHVGLSLMLDDAFRRTALPLFEAGHVDVLEYSFELGWARARPEWAQALLRHYGEAGRLWGHGVTYSPQSAGASARHTAWLQRVRVDCEGLRLRGVSEHYGFMGIDGLDVGAPLPPPPVAEATQVGTAALRALAEATSGPVGLENLALALSPADLDTQPGAIAAMLEATDGYLVLDLHNLWCQAVNFERDAVALMKQYPLERARVLHVSGGSWSASFRRDTHDDRVPQEVFDLLAPALQLCPKLEAVILEQLGPTLADPAAEQGYRDDFMRLREICA